VRVRVNGQKRDIDRQLELIGDGERCLSRRNIERAVVLELQQHWKSRRRFVGEVQPDRRTHRFRLAGGLEVHVQHEIGAGVETPGHVVGLLRGRRSRFPEQEMTFGLETSGHDLQVHSGKPDPGILSITRARPPAGIEKDVGVVHEPRLARQNLDCAYESGRRERVRENEIVELVAALGGKREARRRRQDEIGRSKLPRRDERWRRWSGRSVTFRRTVLHPAREKVDLGIGEPPLANEAAVPGNRRPRGHETPAGHLDDLPRTPGDVSIANQRKRPWPSFVMTRNAIRVEHGGDIARKRWMGCDGVIASCRPITSARGNQGCERDRERGGTSRSTDHGVT
jgi:hypothetical protein